jgi:DNA polymerase III subunit beta
MITLPRAQLAAELALLTVTAERKTTIPILSTVRFEFTGNTLTFTSTDIDTTIITEIEASGELWSGCVPSKQLQELVRLFNGDTVEFTPKPNERIQVKCGKSSHKLPAFPVASFPETQQAQVEMAALDGAQLKTAIVRALRCTSPDAVEAWMHGISLRSRDGVLTVAGTNSRHFAVTEIATTLDVDVLLHVRAATALTKFLDGEVEVGANSNQAVFRQGSKVFATRLLDAKFPDWRPLVPTSFKHSFVLDSAATALAFKLAAVTAKESALIPVPLRLSLSQTELTIETKESEMGHSVETLPIDCPTLNGDKLTIGVNGQHFISFVDLESNPVMAFNDDLRLFQLGVEGEPGYRYITMTLKA